VALRARQTANEAPGNVGNGSQIARFLYCRFAPSRGSDMKKQWFWAVPASVLALSPCLLAQQPVTQPVPLPANILGPPLVAWSQLQKPQPTPQPLSAPESLEQQSSSKVQQPEHPSVQAISGTIVKDGTEYVLKTPDNLIYRIDQQDLAGLYENRLVKVVGMVEARTIDGRPEKTVHITSIET